MRSRNLRDAPSLDKYVGSKHFLKLRNGAEALIIRRIRMIMKDLRIQPKKRPGLDFCDFRLERNSSEKLTFARKSASHSNLANSEEAKLEREATF